MPNWRTLVRRLDGSTEPKAHRKDIWDIISALSPLVTAIVIFVVTFVLKDSVDQAFQREQLHLTSVKDMQELVLTLMKPDVTKEGAQATAMTLAAFGHHAIPSLFSVLEFGDDVRAPAAEDALRAIGLTEPSEACRPMIKVLNDTIGQYSFLTHEAALRIIADVGCAEARPAVQAYAAQLDSVSASNLSAFGKRFKEQSVTRDVLTDLKTQAQRALEGLRTQ